MNASEFPQWTDYLPLIGVFACLAMATSFPLLAVVGIRGRRRERPVGVSLLVLALGLLSLMAWFFGVWAAMSTSWWFCPAFLAWGTGLATLVAVRCRSKAAIVLGGIFAVGLVLIQVADFTPRKPYRRFFDAIENGMSLAEVAAALHREFPSRGKFPRPEMSRVEGNLLFRLDPADGRYNAETITLRLQGEKVTGKIYSGD